MWPFKRPASPERKALEDLVNKLDTIHQDPRYQSVWTLYTIHHGIYTGPRYAAELNEAKRVLNKPVSESADF